MTNGYLPKKALVALLVCGAASAGGLHEEPITASELAASLGVKVRKLLFTFDTPVYVKAEQVVRST